MDDHVTIENEVEGAASIAGPVPIGVLAEVLDVAEGQVVDAVESLEASGRITSSRQGVTAAASELSTTRLTHIARRLADILDRRGAPPAQVGRARWSAGDARRAHDAFLTALDETPADDHLEILGLALDAGREARIPTRSLAPLLVRRARLLRTRGESDRAIADIDAATAHLTGEDLVDALGFAAALHDDRQRPADAERTVAMALLVAANGGLAAKLGSLLTFQGRILARLGFDAETERVFSRGIELVEQHGTEFQRYYATLNQAWTDLDRGWVARAESRYAAAKARSITDDSVALAELDIAIARAKFGTGDAAGAVHLLTGAEQVAATTGAPVLGFLATLARAEGAITFHQPVAAVEAAEALVAIVDEAFPAWRNRAAAVQARALLLAHRRDDARAAIRRGFETTPHGADGIRLRTELEALQLMADERWDEEGAADVADRLLQGGWLLAAAGLLTERSRREKRPELGRAAAALAHRIGATPAAIDAVEAAGLWGDAVSGPVTLGAQRLSHTIPKEWAERWKSVPAIQHALAADHATVATTDSELLDHLDQVLAAAGLAGTDVVLSPSQRRAAGLVTAGSAVLSIGRFVAWIAAAAIVAAVVAIAVRPEPVAPAEAAPATTAATTTTLPLSERPVPIPDELSGQAPFAGGEKRNAVFDASIGEPTGVYWRRQLSGLLPSEPVLRGFNLYAGDNLGYVYGLDILHDGASVFESRMAGAIDVSPAVEAVEFQQDDQSTTLTFAGDDRGNLLVRHVNDTQGEVWTDNFGSAISGPPLVRPESMIVATEEGYLLDLRPSDGTELGRFPAEEAVEGGFEGPLAADEDGVIYARTGTGAVILIDEATFELVCTAFSPSAIATTHVVIDGDRWYVGTAARTVRVFSTGSCADAGVGSLQIDTPVGFAPVISDGVLWAVADAVLLPLDVETGQALGFAASVGRAFTSAPVIAGDLILVATEASELVAFSTLDGTEQWRFDTGDVVRTRPIVANGLVLVATARGELIAIAAPA